MYKISLSKIVFCLIILISSCIQISYVKSYKKDNSDVNYNNFCLKDEQTAIKVAETILISRYGDPVKLNRPFKINLINDSIWAISGTRNKRMIGGVPFIELRKSDCTILKIGHTR